MGSEVLMLADKIIQKTAIIGIIGLGYVGLPLAVLCAKKGYKVIGIDSDKEKIKKLQEGNSYITDVSNTETSSLIEKDILQVSNNYELVSDCDIVIICVPTPLLENNSPDYSYLFNAVDEIAKKLRYGQMIIVESTIAPGTTVEEILPRLTKGLEIGKDFHFVFSPERIDPANQLYRLENTPKLVAGVTCQCQTLGENLYSQLGISTVSVSSPLIAEMSKILENTYRDVNIALINEMTEFCHLKGIDIWEVIEAASTKPFGFQAFYPGPGVGGFCIPKDTIYYIHSAHERGMSDLLAQQARKINTLMPKYVIKRLKSILDQEGKELAGSKILMLGVTYKKDINDVRHSPSITIMKNLVAEGAIVSYHDPYVEQIAIENTILDCTKLDEENVSNKDCIVLAVSHSNYDLAWLNITCPLIFDLTNVMSPYTKNNKRIVKL